jgi:hypothetical protein
MPQVLRLGINCLVVAALTFAGIMAMLWLPIFPFDPRLWAGQYFESLTVTGMWFVYSVLLWAVPGALIAFCMLALKPRMIFLYGLASAITFIVTSQSWYFIIDENAFGYLRELIFVLTIPWLYWIFVRVARQMSITELPLAVVDP